MSRLKSSSSSKSERAIVKSVQEVLAIASVERSERSKIAISPKQAPGLRTASASSPDPGMVREMRTSPSEIMKSRLPGSPSLKTCWPTANFCSRHTSDTRASSPSSRSWKIAACLSKLRFTGRRYGAPEGGASETVGDAGGSPDRASASSGRRVSVRAPAGVAARARGRGGRIGFLRRDAGTSVRRIARRRRPRPDRRQGLHGGGVFHRRAHWSAASSGDRRGPGPGHRGGAGVRGCVAVAAADPAAGPRGWQGGHGAAAAHLGGVHRPLSAGAAARLGDRGGRAIRHLGLQPGGRPGARNANAGEGDVMRQVWLAMLLVAAGSTQMVFGVTLDAGNLVSPRFRIRPSGEIGFFNGSNSYVGSLEALYRFTGDEQTATPYAGAGFSLVGHQSCGADPDCPDLWANLVVGFELHYRSTFNWLLEYHGMGGFRHNRLYVGLTTRRGN